MSYLFKKSFPKTTKYSNNQQNNTQHTQQTAIYSSGSRSMRKNVCFFLCWSNELENSFILFCWKIHFLTMPNILIRPSFLLTQTLFPTSMTVLTWFCGTKVGCNCIDVVYVVLSSLCVTVCGAKPWIFKQWAACSSDGSCEWSTLTSPR